MTRRNIWLLVLFGAHAFAQVPESETDRRGAERISAEEFGALPFMTGLQVSPDGARILARTISNERESVAILTWQTRTLPHQVQVPEGFDLISTQWAGNDKVLISLGEAEKFMGADIYVTRLLIYDIAKRKADFIGKKRQGFDGDTVIHMDKDGRFILLTIQASLYEYPSVWKVDLDTLKMDEVVKPIQGVWNWFADANGVVRAGFALNAKRWRLFYRRTEAGRFTEIRRKAFERDENADVDTFIPSAGSDHGFAIVNLTGRFGLYRYDFAADVVSDAVFVHPEVDIDRLFSNDVGEIDAVEYVDDRRRVEWLDPSMREIQSGIDKALPDRVNRVTSKNRDGSIMIVFSRSATDPGRYYLFQVKSGVMSVVSRPYDKLTGKQLASTASVSYAARDGLKIPAYLTLPYNGADRNLQLIVMPHGGPFLRDEWGYDTWAQFFANRGYAVLQPNFRGSTGYGKAFVEAGMGEWGRKMQDDLDDGVKWLVEQGKVNPKRVCITGASYGGYAAMWAAVRNPDIYRCAISFAGVSDLDTMIRYDRRVLIARRYVKSWRESVQGKKSFDLDSVSPYREAERVAIPLLIAHGAKDLTVPVQQSRKMRDALIRREKPHEYVEYAGERHGFEKVVNSVDFLKRMEAFLQKHNSAE